MISDDKNSSDNLINSRKSKCIYLSLLIFFTLIMIAIGGLTRLTGSGLSMTNWELIGGIVPPITEKRWEEVFATYKKFPEYQKINYTMVLDEFKSIFYFEYFHRILGRLIGLLTLFFLIFFLLKKQLSLREKYHFFTLFVLVSIQGLFGWYMVQSGLVDRPSVSHYRLAGHFILALIFLGYSTFLLLKYLPVSLTTTDNFDTQLNGLNKEAEEKKLIFKTIYKISHIVLRPACINSIVFLFLVQLFYGALTAGMDAGLVSSTYPLMFGEWFPLQIFSSPQSLKEIFFENPFFLNFFHRHLGVVVAVLLCVLSLAMLTLSSNVFMKRTSLVLLLLSFLQPLLGILSLIFYIPISLASFHQMVAIFIFECLVIIKFYTKNSSILSKVF